MIASGLWSSEVARLAGVSVSLYPAEHVWVMTEPDPEAREASPFLRDLDGSLYIRHYRGGYLVGAFEPRGKPKAPTDIDTDGFVEFGEDWDHFAPVLANARRTAPRPASDRVPPLPARAGVVHPRRQLPSRPFPERPGLWIAAGLNSQGVIFAPGVGTALAEWIVEGRPTYDLAEVDVSRFGTWANDRAWLHAKTAETLGRLYAMHWPGLQSEVARGARWVPLADRLRAEGAAFGEAAGWERPAWYEPGALSEPTWRYDFDRPSWFGPVAEEVRACREAAAFFDLSTYAKFLVEGPEALDGLQRMCASDVDVAIGRVVYTLLCNEQGGVEMDPTVTRLAEDRFLILAPTVWHRRTYALLRAGVPAGAHLTDVTNAYAALHVAGPASRDVLAEVVDADLADDAFPFLTAKEVAAGWATAWALRVSYTGELGWELYVPAEFANGVHASIAAAGRDAGLRHAGAFAFDALRVERGFRSWGHDIGPVDDPFASGLAFAVSRRKDADFIGRDVLESLRDRSARAQARLGPPRRSRIDALARRAGLGGRTRDRPRDQRGVRHHARRARRARVGPRRGSGSGRGRRARSPDRRDDRRGVLLRPEGCAGSLTSSFTLLGVPIDSVGRNGGTEMAPGALREVGLATRWADATRGTSTCGSAARSAIRAPVCSRRVGDRDQRRDPRRGGGAACRRGAAVPRGRMLQRGRRRLGGRARRGRTRRPRVPRRALRSL